MSEEKQTLNKRSNELLEAVHHLRETEQRKRNVPISTPAFHDLAKEVDSTSRDIFRLAREQDDLGDRIPTGPDTIEDVDRNDRASRRGHAPSSRGG
jgi:hypothetical protein